MNFNFIFTIWLLYLTKINGFFFGGGSNCNCPPPAPPPVCPPSSCGGFQHGSGFVSAPQTPQLYDQRSNFFLPQPPVQPSYVLPQGPTQNQIVAPPAPAAPPAPIVSPTPFIQPPPIEIVPDVQSSGGNYVNPEISSNNEFNYQTLEPPRPPPFTPKHVETKENNNDLFPDYGKEGDAVVPQIPTLAPESQGYIKSQSQIEVAPSDRHMELSYDKLAEDNGDISSKVVKKGKKTTSTTTTTTTTPEMAMSMDIYDEKVPDVDPLSENSSKDKLQKSDILANDFSVNSFRVKVAGVKSRLENDVSGRDAVTDTKCANSVLKRIMLENIVNSPTISKQLIFSAGKMKFQRPIDVVCSRNKFSYTVVSSKVYCEVTKRPVTCFAFFQP